MSKSPDLRGPLDRPHGKRAEAFIDHNESALVILSDHCEGN